MEVPFLNLDQAINLDERGTVHFNSIMNCLQMLHPELSIEQVMNMLEFEEAAESMDEGHDEP